MALGPPICFTSKRLPAANSQALLGDEKRDYGL